MAISNIWTIQGATGVATSFHARNLGAVKAQFTTQAPDQFNCTQAEAYDADPEFAYGDTVTVFRDGAQWFKGTCTAIKRRGNGTAERIGYTISGPWWQLQKVTYEQTFLRYIGQTPASTKLVKLILGADDNGQRLNSGQVITSVVGYAASELGSAALFQLGTVDVATEMPYEELNALTCAEVISRVLRWNPDVVAYFDYSTSTPTLHLKRRANLPTRTHAHSEVTITDASINPRNDLQIDRVVVQYERIDTIDDEEHTVILTDAAGSSSDPTKTLNFFFDLQGAFVSYVRQKVVSKSIQESSANWWAKRHPKLKNATSISVANSSKEAVDDSEENDGTSYGKELVSGSIADWMDGVGTCAQIVKADVSYTPDGGSAKTETLRLQVTGTDANDQVYDTVGSKGEAEPTPQGLASAIRASVNQLQYEGTIILTQEDVGAVTHLDRRVNLSGGRVEWASMGAQVYRVDYDLDGGRTQISFGPAKHLGANDLFQLYRNVRTRKPAAGLAVATTRSGQSLPTRSPNTLAADEGGGDPDYAFKVVNEGGGTIKVLAGAVNTIDVAEATASNPTGVWLKVTVDADGQVTAASIVGLDPGADTATQTSRKVATITWSDGVPSIVQGIRGSQNIVSCGVNHGWSSLYL